MSSENSHFDKTIYDINDPCGGAIILNEDFTECLLVETKDNHLSNPKGKIHRKDKKNLKKDSHFVAGCFREIDEEVGRKPKNLTIFLTKPLIELSDKGNPSIQYLISYTKKIPNEKFKFDENELKSVNWYPVENALKNNNFKKRRRDILYEALTIVKDKSLATINGQEFLELFKEIEEPKQDQQLTTKEIEKISRSLSKVLRHKAKELGLDMDSEGYVKLDKLLNLSMFKGVTITEIELVVKLNDKQRFSLKKTENDYLIRANQAHNASMAQVLDSDKLYIPIQQPLDVCIHGTNKQFISSIQKTGLHKMERLHIHMIPCEPDDKNVVSGLKMKSNVLIYIDMKKAMDDGMKFYLSTNNVVLSDGFDGVIDPKYFQMIKYV